MIPSSLSADHALYAAYRECRWQHPGDMVTPGAIAHMLRHELPGWLWERAGIWRYLTARQVAQIIESGGTGLEIDPGQAVREKALPCGFYRVEGKWELYQVGRRKR